MKASLTGPHENDLPCRGWKRWLRVIAPVARFALVNRPVTLVIVFVTSGTPPVLLTVRTELLTENRPLVATEMAVTGTSESPVKGVHARPKAGRALTAQGPVGEVQEPVTVGRDREAHRGREAGGLDRGDAPAVVAFSLGKRRDSGCGQSDARMAVMIAVSLPAGRRRVATGTSVPIDMRTPFRLVTAAQRTRESRRRHSGLVRLA